MTETREQLLQFLRESDPAQQLILGIQRGLKQQLAYGLTGSQQSSLLASLSEENNRPIVVAAYDEARAKELTQELGSLLPHREILFLPKRDFVQTVAYYSNNQVALERIKVLSRIMQNHQLIVVTSIENLGKKVLAAHHFQQGFLTLKVTQVVDIEKLTAKLIAIGYERVDTVETPGQFAWRGGILDCYSLHQDYPARIEFFDEEIDSIRIFDVETQRSMDKTDCYDISPALEFFLTESDNVNMLAKKIQGLYEKQLDNMEKLDSQLADSYITNYGSVISNAWAGIFNSKLEQGFGLLPQLTVPLLDFFEVKPLVFTLEPSKCWEQLGEYLEFCQDAVWEMFGQGNSLLKEDKLFLQEGEIQDALSSVHVIYMALMPRKKGKLKPEQVVSFSGNLMYNYHGNMELVQQEIDMYQSQGYQISIALGSEGEKEKLQHFLGQWTNKTTIFVSNLTKGFVIHEAKVVVITTEDLFGQQQKKKIKKKTGEKIASFVELKPGDYVVHDNHGIGKYLGLEQLAVGDIIKDYMVIKYAGADKLYVPTDQVDHIQRYIGVEGRAPKVFKLGGNDWNRIKNRVKESVQELAKELLQLYATREATEGYSFSLDNSLQYQFEEEFPYVETEDQLKAIEQVKKDMELLRPMDRLLCGDVGYGKTEVALRAAFKAVMDSKQVAVLVPTTILAQQHYENFSKRFSNYPINVEVMSRFKTPKQIKEIKEKAKNGLVDVIIGTHSLLSKDVVFYDLGLLVVDEEQRFGVAHKEKLKKLKANIDVLTLSATPIPRTLHMSLVGIRDLSVIETPPEDRYPVQTYVVEENPQIIKEAITRELNRGGQVFYLYNRVADIEQVARKIQQLVPYSRIGVTHGQMKEKQLEEVMLNFIEKQLDVLVCTTIIENGLDIPNVNTIIVSEADKLGLSQLYQLRGRVGRSNRIAYAYLTYQKDKVLTEVAEKRLAAIKEFTHLGAGFKIAMRDLEIRGSGNILGPEQHGNMMSVGFDLYCRLLEQAVEELKGVQPEKREIPAIELDISAYLTDSYVPDNTTKINIYKKLLVATKEEELNDIIDELIDRFGDLPQEAANLMEITKLRIAAYQLGISKVKQEQGLIKVIFNKDPALAGEDLLMLTRGMKEKMSFNSSGPLEIRLKISGIHSTAMIKVLNEIFGRLKALFTNN